MRTLTYAVAPAEEGQTVERVLLDRLSLSKSLIRRLKRRDTGILLNGARAFTTARVRSGDVLAVEIGDAAARAVPPADVPLSIAYEDEDLLVIDKPAGMAVHPTQDPDETTLEHALSAYLKPGESPHPVSRLDRGTSGLMTVAKNGYMHELLRRRLHTEAFYREYRGVSLGVPQPAAGRVALPIGFAPGSRYRRAAAPDGAPSCTGYETLAAWETGGRAFALLRLIPYTGRTHQLRVHMAAIGCPLAGDWLYGTEEPALIGRPALHSALLRLEHPLTGECLSLASSLPPDMAALLPPDAAATAAVCGGA